MNPDSQNWLAPINQKLVRYEALVQLFEEIQALDDIGQIAGRAATRWKYFANVASWRLYVRHDPGFLVIDGDRGEATVAPAAVLDAWLPGTGPGNARSCWRWPKPRWPIRRHRPTW